MNFGIISPPVPGHLYPNGIIARELIKRGHKVTIYNILDTKELVEKLGIAFYPIAEKHFPLNSWNTYWKSARTGSNLLRHFHVLKMHMRIAKQMLEELPEILRQQQVDALLVDQLQPQGAALAMQANIPYITICSILPIHINYDGENPPAFAWWQPTNSSLNRLINILGHKVANLFSLPYINLVNKFMKKWKLSRFSNLNETFSKHLQIGLVPSAFDFPRTTVNPLYFSFGSFVESRESISFPWDLLDNKPLVYVSMGTIRNCIEKIYNALLPALEAYPNLQVVLTKGAWKGDGFFLDKIPINFIVVDYAPQLELLKKASFCITHGGPGTVMECIYHGVPMICIPVTDDQPAMAARVKYHGLGEVIPWRKVSKKRIKNAINNLLGNTSYKVNCLNISEKIQRNQGIKKAVDFIENVLNK